MTLRSELAALLASAFVFTPGHASPYFKTMQPCKGPFDNAISAAIASTTDFNQKISARVETVPPDMEKYVKSEIHNAIKQKRLDHYLSLTMENRFYEPVQINDELKNIALALSIAQHANGKDVAGNKLSKDGLLQAISDYTDLMDDIQSYAYKDAQRPKPYLSKADGFDMFFFAKSAQEVLVKLLSCMLLK